MGGRVLASRREATCAAAGSTRDSGRPRRGSKAAGRGQGRDGSGSIGAALRASTLTLWSTSCGTYPREGAGPIRALRAGSVYWGGGLGVEGCPSRKPGGLPLCSGRSGLPGAGRGVCSPGEGLRLWVGLGGDSSESKGLPSDWKRKIKNKRNKTGRKSTSAWYSIKEIKTEPTVSASWEEGTRAHSHPTNRLTVCRDSPRSYGKGCGGTGSCPGSARMQEQGGAGGQNHFLIECATETEP